jgi:hypothetical protein
LFPLVSVEVDARGTATHPGRFTLDFNHVVDFRDFTLVQPATATLTAANGDFLTTSVVAGAVSPQDTPDVFLIEEIHTITGGTGRFAEATGRLVVERLTTLPDPSVGTTWGSL